MATGPTTSCRVYWGSHGCKFERGHEGPHICDCCHCDDHHKDNEIEPGVLCVGAPPYYDDERDIKTRFYGEDAGQDERSMPVIRG